MVKIVSKSELMRPVILGLQHECFDHETDGVFDVTEMRARADELGKLVEVPMENVAPFIAEARVIDMDRVMELNELSWKHDPGIALVMESPEEAEDGTPTVMIVDGSHRAIRRSIEKCKTMRFWMIPIAKAIRPAEGWVKNPFVDWGDQIIEGQIVKRG